jgi:hypothetical protein
MVNPGHSSKGCMTCRRRHIKCDEGRPRCEKCKASKRMCLGYEAQSAKTKMNGDQHGQPTEHEAAPARPAHGKYENMFMKSHKRVLPGDSIICGAVDGAFAVDHHDQQSKPYSPHHKDKASIISSFVSLRESSHTLEYHRALQTQYRTSIRNLRTQLSTSGGLPEDSYLPAYLFALYEVSTPDIRPSS